MMYLHCAYKNLFTVAIYNNSHRTGLYHVQNLSIPKWRELWCFHLSGTEIWMLPRKAAHW